MTPGRRTASSIVATELALHDAVGVARLLLLAKLEGAVGQPRRRRGLRSRGSGALLAGALRADAALPLQHELVAVAAAEPTDRSGISSHSDPR